MMSFNLKRFSHLSYIEYYKGFSNIIKIMVGIAIAIYIIMSLVVLFSDDADQIFIVNNYGVFLFIGGIVYSTLIFSEFWRTPSRAEYLSLPASTLEKYLVKWLFSSILYILLVSILFYILTIIFQAIWSIWDSEFEIVNGIFSSKNYWTITGVYFVVQSIFLFGSIAFNRGAIFKTVFALLLIGIGIALLNGIVFRITFYDWFDGFFKPAAMDARMSFGNRYENPKDMPQIRFFIFAFKFLLAPLMWIAGIFKLSEKEL